MQAYMQASLMAQMGWPLPRDTHAGESEDADYARQEGFREIHIAGEMLKVSLDGLAAVHKTTQAAACLQAQLATVKHTVEYVSNTTRLQVFKHPGGDDLELRSARALRKVDDLLRQQAAKEAPPLPRAAVENLRLLQRCIQDVALLACSRGIDQKALQSKGIPPELFGRLEAAFGQAALQDDLLWSRLCNSKWHVFTHFLFGKRKHRHGRLGRKSRRSQTDAAEDEASAEGGDPVANSSAASSDLPAGATAAPARVATTSAASSWEGVGEAMHLPVPWPLSKEAMEVVRSVVAASWEAAPVRISTPAMMAERVHAGAACKR